MIKNGNPKCGLILDFTKNEIDTATLIKNIRIYGFDTVAAFDKLHPWFDGSSSWFKKYSSCIIIKNEHLSDDDQTIYNEAHENLAILEIEDWSKISLNDVKEFLSANKCKLWNFKEAIEEIIGRIRDFLPIETPIIDVSESIYSVIAALLVKRAIGVRACRFVFYDRGVYSEDKITEYLSALKGIDIYAEYIDIKNKFKPEPDYTNRDVTYDYLMYTYEIHEKPLKELYGDTIDGNGLVCSSKRDYTGIWYDYVHHFTGVWRPYYAVKSITPCDRFFNSEFDDVATALELPEDILKSTKSLFGDN